MTHNCPSHEFRCIGLLDHIYTNVWKDSPYFIRYNFGTIEVEKNKETRILNVHMSIVDIHGIKVVNKSITIDPNSNP
jgi:hypothetical protein